MVAATCGNLYRGLVGRLKRYPIPEMRLKNGAGRLLVDVGCNWGRWCLAAAREGFIPVGIDPQLGAVLAAKRVAEQHGVKARFICADARHLPLREGVADVVFSYSVIQHLSREDATEVIDDARRILKANGRLYVQMPNVLGLRCLFQWAKRGFTDGAGFEVRYWTPGQLTRAFGRIGPVRLETDCFFGIGLQPADADLMPGSTRRLLKASERLRAAGFPTTLADSVYVNAVRQS
jgi:SAM-dependent methyltransferase